MPAKRKRDAIKAQLDELDRKYQSKFEEHEKKHDKLEIELQQQGKDTPNVSRNYKTRLQTVVLALVRWVSCRC